MAKNFATETQPRRAGRPRGYDPEVALDKAAQLFWKHGYSAVSLDDLVLATGMKRPSLAAAFGDKRAIYLRTLERYRDRSRAQAEELLAESPDLKTFLNRFYAAAIDIYVSSDDSALGCYSIGTAPTQAVTDPAVRQFLSESICATDALFLGLFRKAAGQQATSPGAGQEGLAYLATAALHTLAIRARAGATRRELENLSILAVEMLCSRPARSGGGAK